MTKPVPGIKIPYFVAEQYPVVAGFRCVQIHIPDDPLFMALLGGLLKLPARAFNWKGTDFPTRLALASMWRDAYDFNDWDECMDCESLQECLQPLFDALREQINQDAVFREYGTENPVGEPLSPEAAETPLAPGSNPACDLDILWSQCEQLVDYSNIMITDTLEQVETATNNIELVTVITQLPIIDELGGDAIAGYVELLVDGIAENYAAEYDLAYRNGLACEIFCVCQVDCEITIDRVYGVLLSRVVSHFGSPGEALSSITNLLSYLIDQDIDGDVIVDSLMFLLWGGAKLINTFLQDVGTKALQTILFLAVNDANDDWILLCPECPDLIEVDLVGLFNRCGEGDIDHFELENGETVEIGSYSITGGHCIAVTMPNTENWTVEVVSVTGWTALGSGDSVYGWHDETDTFHNVLVSSGDTPMDFGTKDTHDAVFASWCATWGFNAAWLSATSFTMVIRVTRIEP